MTSGPMASTLTVRRLRPFFATPMSRASVIGGSMSMTCSRPMCGRVSASDRA